MGREVEVEQRVKPLLEADLKKAGLRYGAPVFLRIFKREKELELWMQGDGKDYVLFRSYPICTYSGELGPKLRQGDGQAPEGLVATGWSTFSSSAMSFMESV